MIRGLQLRDFKAFANIDIPLRRLTVFVGENNSGKSSVIAAIRLLAQTVQSADNTVPLIFDGAFGDFGSFRDVVHGNHRGRPMQIGVTVPIRSRVRTNTLPTSVGEARLLSEFKYRQVRKETILKSSALHSGSRHLITVRRANDSDNLVLNRVGKKTVPSAVRAQISEIVRVSNFNPLLRNSELAFRDRTGRSDDFLEILKTLRGIEGSARRASDAVSSALRQVEVIGAMRQPPNRTYLHSGSVSRRIGPSGENWGGLVALAMSGRARDPLMPAVREWMSSAGIAADIQVSWLSDRHFEIMVEHPITRERENIADVGRGTSQVLPVIIGGLRLDPDDTYLVEEPEIHLHPRAQASLGDYFLTLTERGVQSIVETHSEYLILRLQQHVAAGRLNPRDVIFYYVGSDPRLGKTLTQLTLDDNAVFSEMIPGGFFPQRTGEATNLVRARSKRNAD